MQEQMMNEFHLNIMSSVKKLSDLVDLRKPLRTIPVILDICKEIEQYSKDAWLINFTNPAGMVTEAVHKYTTVKAIGLCNVPINMKQMSANILEVNREDLNMSFAGLNHLVYATKVFVNGEDKMDTPLSNESLKDGI